MTLTPASPLPTGTVTFLRTDVEGSMRRIRRLGSMWDEVNAAHLLLVRDVIQTNGGVVVRTEGDACFAAFHEARAAALAAVELQRAIAVADLDPEGLLVRVGLHTGEAHLAGDDYGGFEVNRAARIAATGHGGQIVLSDTTRALIVDELPPGTSLRDLGTHSLRDVARPERLSQLSVSGLRTTFPPLRTQDRALGDLPPRVTSFIGREAALDAIAELTGTAQLITLTGPGGIGKTSLAVEVARTIAARYPDGAWFVPLASLSDPAGLAGAIGHRIGLLDGPERPAGDALMPYLAERSLVLVLDNVEHLLDGVGVVADLMRISPGSRYIATSRAPLHLSGEHEVPVGPLTDGALRLFLERAQATRPGWDPGGDAEVIREICTLLDDLPLGIELAAARVALLPPIVLRDRLAARLPLPGVGLRDVPSRQRTLEGAVAWSHDLLSPHQQRLLQTLAVFEGGADLEQVMAVADPPPPGGDHLDELLHLVDQSLLVPATDVPGRIRFRMLRTIRAFALTRLVQGGREAETRRRHAEAILALLLEARPHLNTSRHASWVDRLEPDQANLRSAVHWAIETGEADLALRLTGALWRVWQALGLVADGRTLAEQALAMPTAPTSGAVRARAEAAAGNLAYWQADSVTAHQHYLRQIELAEAAGDEACLADGWFNQGHVLYVEGASEESTRTLADSVIGRYRALGDDWGVARATWTLAIVAMSAGRPEEAYERLLHDLQDFDRLDDRQYHAMTLASLGWAAYARGDIPTAIRHSVDALVETHAMRDRGSTAISLHNGVLMASMLGRYQEAARLSGAFEGLCQRFGVRPPASLERFIGGMDAIGPAREALPPDVFRAAVDDGRRMSLDDAVALIAALGDVAAGVADPPGPITSGCAPGS